MFPDYNRAAAIIDNGIRNATEGDIDYLTTSCTALLDLEEFGEICARVEIRQPCITTFKAGRQAVDDIAAHPYHAVQSIDLRAAAVLAEIFREASAAIAH